MGMEKEVHSGKWNRLSATLVPPPAFGASPVLLLCAHEMLLRLPRKRGPSVEKIPPSDRPGGKPMGHFLY